MSLVSECKTEIRPECFDIGEQIPPLDDERNALRDEIHELSEELKMAREEIKKINQEIWEIEASQSTARAVGNRLGPFGG